MTYVITSEEPRTVRVKYACGGEVGECEVTLGRAMRYVVELIKG